MSATPVERQVTLRDGTTLAHNVWAGPDTRRGTVVISHGLGEHANRYAELAGDLIADGWQVHASDHRGHGRSPGARGVVPAVETIRDDVIELLHYARATGPAPIVLLGHSMGGAFAAWAIAHEPTAADALVLSSPALMTHMTGFQRLMMRTMLRLSPDTVMGNGLDANFISHDHRVVAAYRDDPLVHDRVSARLASAIVTAGDEARAQAARWRTPTLLLYAGADKLVNPRGSELFAAAAPSSVVNAQRFGTLYHELFNEQERAQPVSALRQWLRTLPAVQRIG